MNLRTLLIIAGLALPIVAFAILSQTSPESSQTKQAPVSATTVKKEPAGKSKKAASSEDSVNAKPAPKNDDKAATKAKGPMSAPPVILPPLDKNAATKPQPVPFDYMTLEQAIDKVKTRLNELKDLTPEEWPEARKNHPNAPLTLQEALDYNLNRLAKLSKMTPQQWDEEQQKRAKRVQKNNKRSAKPQLNTQTESQTKMQMMRDLLKQQANSPQPASIPAAAISDAVPTMDAK